MMSDAKALSEMERARSAYLETRAAMGIPLNDAAPNAELPAWIRRAGQASAPRDWVPIRAQEERKTTVQAPAAKPATVAAPTVSKLVQEGAQGIGRAGTVAEQVREMIREAMAKDLTVESVIERCKTELGFADSKAKRYATENWERVKKAGKR